MKILWKWWVPTIIFAIVCVTLWVMFPPKPYNAQTACLEAGGIYLSGYGLFHGSTPDCVFPPNT